MGRLLGIGKARLLCPGGGRACLGRRFHRQSTPNNVCNQEAAGSFVQPNNSLPLHHCRLHPATYQDPPLLLSSNSQLVAQDFTLSLSHVISTL